MLKYAFNQLDVIGGRGGLEAHPRLTMGTHYRAADKATTMRKAQKTVLSLAPQGFSTSLSGPAITIYGKGHSDIILVRAGINVAVCLKKGPSTSIGVQPMSITSLTDAKMWNMQCVISEDAKAINSSDIAPVQHPGHSWRKRDELATGPHLQPVKSQCYHPNDFSGFDDQSYQTTVHNVEELDH